jgi:transcriptional regulator with XRE-family HTH domain
MPITFNATVTPDVVATSTAVPGMHPDFNELVGASVQRFRKARGMSQADLARELSRLGLPFQQQTVLKVEKGTRPLKFEEAYAIAVMLGVDPAALVENADDEEWAQAIMQRLNAEAIADKCKVEIEEHRLKITLIEKELARAELLQREAEVRIMNLHTARRRAAEQLEDADRA